MKIKYHEWKCIGCGNTTRFTGKDVLSVPYWFTITTERCISSSEQPNFNTTACSIGCLQKAGAIIDDSIKNRKHLIPNKKHIEATACDHCGKVAMVDSLNMIIGPGPLRDWTWEQTPAGRKDFCGEACKKNHVLHPEESVFVDFKPNNQFLGISSLIEILNSPDVKEAIRLLNENSKRSFFLRPVT